MTENEISKEILDTAITVHRTMAGQALESHYEAALSCELEMRGLMVDCVLGVSAPLR